MVREVPAHYLSQPSPLFGNRVVHSLAHLLLYRLQRTPHAVSTRMSSENESAGLVLSADMRKTKKRECFRFTQAAFGTSFGSISSKFDQTRLIGVQ